jgi:hypothetical protein
MDFQIEFTDKEVTLWAGILILKKMLDKMDFDGCLEALNLLKQGSNRGYRSDQLIKQFMTSVWCGANKFEHTEVALQDEVIRQFWGFERMAGHKSFQRSFNKFDLSTDQKAFTVLYQWFFKNLQFNNFTLDVDSTVHTRYGTQQGAKKGYNPKKPGRLSHHPLMAFVSECKMVANFWFPAYVNITDGKTADNKGAYDLPLLKGSVIVADRFYNDLTLLNVWDSKWVHFVIRHKENLQYVVLKEHEPPEGRHSHILKDDTIELKNPASKEKYPKRLRRVALWDDVNEQTIEIITNQMRWTAYTIGELLQKPLADRDILPRDQAIASHQNIHRHNRKCGHDTDMDCLDNHSRAKGVKGDSKI